MALLRNLILALLLVGWIPATNACALAAAFAEKPEPCCAEARALHDSSAPCDTSCAPCVSFEGGFPIAVAQPLAMPVLWVEDFELTRLLAQLAVRPGAEVVPPAESPPREIPLWHFVARTALPVRGPAFA